ncbi:tetratricopeptide repeat protein [Aureispira anguillae]|uniref:Tetratricopeptide repeat-containing protein n=1 Tax=Aureispira anguillae TaxID=2864201 RepID=A0A916DUX7_9BACT|nr:hypothetical protein [Aureispira anguillae]BDS14544.1 hypothetical protein AsAng_0053240 [Aureispira anguillae]
MANVEKSRLIEAYYRGTLNGADKGYLKQLMSEDPSFRQEVKDYKHIFNGLEALHVEHFQANLAQMEKKYQDNVVAMSPKTTIRPFQKLYYAAAAVALLICCSITYHLMTPSVFDQHFAASESIAVHIESIRAGGQTMSTEEQIKKSAFTAYQQKEYSQSISLLKDYLNTYPETASKDYQSILVLGVAQLAEGKVEQATRTLELVIKGRDSSYKQEAEWMWVLAQIKLDNKEAAKKVLQDIIDQKGHIHKEKALEVQHQL